MAGLYFALGVRRQKLFKKATDKTQPKNQQQINNNNDKNHPRASSLPTYMASSTVGINLHSTFEFCEALKIYKSSEAGSINGSFWNGPVCLSVSLVLSPFSLFS